MNKKVMQLTTQINLQEYFLRILGYLFIALVVATGIYTHDFNKQFLWLIPYSLLYPQLVYFATLRFKCKKPVRCYRLRVILDALQAGAISAWFGFAIIPSLLGLIIIAFTALIAGGLVLMLAVILSAVAAAATIGFVCQPELMLETQLAVSIVSLVLAGLFICLTGYFVHFQGRYIGKIQLENQCAQERTACFADDVSKYLSPQIRDTILAGKRAVKLETRREHITVFFSDIKDFTSLTEEMEAEALTDLLNHYLRDMSQIALKHGGTIDKFIGDSIMVFFGDPSTQGVKKDAMAAVSMAIEMREHMKILRQHWRMQGIDKPFEIRMGINSGYCTVGNFGTEHRMDYTIIGHEVNLASRLESVAHPGDILISNATYALIKHKIMARGQKAITVKGFSNPIQTFKVIDFHSHLGLKSSYLEHSVAGFSMYLDTSNISQGDKKEVIYTLKDAAERLLHQRSAE